MFFVRRGLNECARRGEWPRRDKQEQPNRFSPAAADCIMRARVYASASSPGRLEAALLGRAIAYSSATPARALGQVSRARSGSDRVSGATSARSFRRSSRFRPPAGYRCERSGDVPLTRRCSLVSAGHRGRGRAEAAGDERFKSVAEIRKHGLCGLVFSPRLLLSPFSSVIS